MKQGRKLKTADCNKRWECKCGKRFEDFHDFEEHLKEHDE